MASRGGNGASLFPKVCLILGLAGSAPSLESDSGGSLRWASSGGLEREGVRRSGRVPKIKGEVHKAKKTLAQTHSIGAFAVLAPIGLPLCEGCLVVGCDHGPQAEVAQGVGPGPLVER